VKGPSGAFFVGGGSTGPLGLVRNASAFRTVGAPRGQC